MKKPLDRRDVLKLLLLTGMTQVAQVATPYFGVTKAQAQEKLIKRYFDRKDRQQRVECDVVLIGAGVMSATLGVFLKELSPNLTIEVIERLDKVAGESSGAWNNAGTGHSALCELNYSPENPDGSIDLSKALKVLESFEQSKQFWSYLVNKGSFAAPRTFINSVPHMSLVWGDKNISYLHRRYEAMRGLHPFKAIKYSEDPAQLTEWMPLVMKGGNLTRRMAASRNELGTDVNFTEVTKGLFKHLRSLGGTNLFLDEEVRNLHQDSEKYWHLLIKNKVTGDTRKLKTKFVFIGAGGGSLPLLEKSKIMEGQGYGGFPVGGQFLVCKNRQLVEEHHAKVYGLASVGSPPMSVPHLDSRVIDGKKELIFGPYAGFSTRFLKKGSTLDLPLSVDIHNIKTLLGAGAHNVPLTRYLIGQVMQSDDDRLNALRDFMPDAKKEDWELTNAGQRVQVIKKDEKEWGVLQFGTEVVAAGDGTIAALLGASPGASTSVSIMLEVLARCFKTEIKSEKWQAKLKEMIPTYGKHLANEPDLLDKTREWTHKVLELTLV